MQTRSILSNVYDEYILTLVIVLLCVYGFLHSLLIHKHTHMHTVAHTYTFHFGKRTQRMNGQDKQTNEEKKSKFIFLLMICKKKENRQEVLLS